MRKISFLPLFVWFFALIFGGYVSASSYTVTEESDWYFEIEQDGTDVVIYGNSNSSCTQLASDPFLWLYDLSGTVLASNDDGNHNNETQCVSSKIDTTLDAGVYRLHAGYCCSQRGNGYDGGEYELVTDLTLATDFSTYNGVRFSYTPAYIEQTIDVSSYAGEIDSVIVTPLVKRFYDVNDYVATQYAAYDSSGNLLQGNLTSSAPTSWVEVGSGWFQASISSNVQDSTNWATVKIRIWAKDGEGWGGNYGTEIKQVSFQAKLDGSTEWTDLTNLLTNPYFNSINSNSPPNGWSSNASWDTCQGLYTSTLCGFVVNTWTWATPVTTTTSTTTTTVAQSIGPPMNLTGEVTESGVYLDWDAPNTGNVEPERYAISFRIPPDAGWGVATGNVGDENALNTEYTLPFSIFENTGGLDETYVFDIRSDNDTLGLYSGWSSQVELLVSIPTPTTTTTTTTWVPTTTSTTTTTSSTTVPPTTTTTSAPATTTVPPTTTTTTVAPTTTTTVPPTTSSTTSTTSSTSTTTTTTTTVPPPPPSTTSTTTTTTVPPTTTTSTTTTTSSTSTTVPSTTTTSSTSTTTTTEPAPIRVPNQQETAIIEAIEDEVLAEAVEELFTGEADVETVVALVSSESFDDLDEETLDAVSVALSEAPVDVKEEFQSEVNVFEGSFDEYVPTGSRVNVEDRRVLVAVTATTSAIAAAPVAKSSGGSGGGGSGGGAGPSRSRRKWR